jgi:hypothetical protein
MFMVGNWSNEALRWKDFDEARFGFRRSSSLGIQFVAVFVTARWYCDSVPCCNPITHLFDGYEKQDREISAGWKRHRSIFNRMVGVCRIFPKRRVDAGQGALSLT